MRRYAVSSWHQLADSSERFGHRRLAPGWLFRMVAWVFRRLGAASAHPSAKEYLAPLRMKVGRKLSKLTGRTSDRL
jgi:hypothetical protein